MDDYILKLVVIVVVLWTAVFLFIRKIFPNRSFNFCSRLVSTIHATLAVTLTSPPFKTGDAQFVPWLQTLPLASGSELVVPLWIIEISSPFLHCREMLKELGYRDTGLNLTADVTFAAIFTFARMVCEPHLTYLTPSARNPIIIKWRSKFRLGNLVKWNLMMLGDGIDATIISGNQNFMDGWTIFRSATFGKYICKLKN
ncbi:hypothetical protein WN943_003539 [Citrus x changshan-huyou]